MIPVRQSLSRACQYRRCSVLVLAKKQSPEAREKKAKRRQFEDRQKDKKLHIASTQHTDVWYENTAGGIWVEHRRTPQEKAVRAEQKEARQGQAPYSPTMKELLRGSSAQQRPPALVKPTLWTQLQLPTFNPHTRRMLQLGSDQQQQQQQQLQPLSPATTSSSQNTTSREPTASIPRITANTSTPKSTAGSGGWYQGGGSSSSSMQLSASSQIQELWAGQTASLHTPLHALMQWDLQPGAWNNPNPQVPTDWVGNPQLSPSGYRQPAEGDELQSSTILFQSHPQSAAHPIAQTQVQQGKQGLGKQAEQSTSRRGHGQLADQDHHQSSANSVVSQPLSVSQQQNQEPSASGASYTNSTPPVQDTMSPTPDNSSKQRQSTQPGMKQPAENAWTDEDLGGYSAKPGKIQVKVKKDMAVQDKGGAGVGLKQSAGVKVKRSSSSSSNSSGSVMPPLDRAIPDNSDW